MNNTFAMQLADVFERFSQDHAPDGYPAVKQEMLNQAALELRRLSAFEQDSKAGGRVAAVVLDASPRWVKNAPELRNGTLLYAILPANTGSSDTEGA